MRKIYQHKNKSNEFIIFLIVTSSNQCTQLSSLYKNYVKISPTNQSLESNSVQYERVLPAEFNLWSWFLCLICDRVAVRVAVWLLADEVELVSGLGPPLVHSGGSVTRSELGGLSEPDEQWCRSRWCWQAESPDEPLSCCRSTEVRTLLDLLLDRTRTTVKNNY